MCSSACAGPGAGNTRPCRTPPCTCAISGRRPRTGCVAGARRRNSRPAAYRVRGRCAAAQFATARAIYAHVSARVTPARAPCSGEARGGEREASSPRAAHARRAPITVAGAIAGLPARLARGPPDDEPRAGPGVDLVGRHESRPGSPGTTRRSSLHLQRNNAQTRLSRGAIHGEMVCSTWRQRFRATIQGNRHTSASKPSFGLVRALATSSVTRSASAW